MTQQQIAYVPILVAVTVLSVVLMLLDAPIWGQPAAVPTPTPVVIVNVVATPVVEFSTDDALASLRNQLPTLDQFRGEQPVVQEMAIQAPSVVAMAPGAGMPYPVSERTYLAPNGATMLMRWMDVGEQRYIEYTTGEWVPCAEFVQGTVRNWSEWPDYVKVELTTTCGG